MPERTCDTPECLSLTHHRKGAPAKHCLEHLTIGKCTECGVPTKRAPGTSRGPLPSICSEDCRKAREARKFQTLKMTPAYEIHKLKTRNSLRTDMFCRGCSSLIPRRDNGVRRDIRCPDCRAKHDQVRKARDARGKKFRQYGITEADYDRMLADQGGGCRFCGTTQAHPTICPYDFHIDHDHSCCPGTRSCGRCVRFLLCYLCNPGLGYFRDNPQVLRAAADYLETHRTVHDSNRKKEIA